MRALLSTGFLIWLFCTVHFLTSEAFVFAAADNLAAQSCLQSFSHTFELYPYEMYAYFNFV